MRRTARLITAASIVTFLFISGANGAISIYAPSQLSEHNPSSEITHAGMGCAAETIYVLKMKRGENTYREQGVTSNPQGEWTFTFTVPPNWAISTEWDATIERLGVEQDSNRFHVPDDEA